jgi:hypothetical protein
MPVPNLSAGQLALYIGSRLGPYTPPSTTIFYGASHDPMTTYNIISLLGLPIHPAPDIDETQPAIICSAYISGDMITNLDEYMQKGGVVILDAIAAKCYRTYGGKAEFNITGPISLQRYEIDPQGQRFDIIADCHAETTYLLESDFIRSGWTSYDINDRIVGSTTIVIPFGKGRLVVLGIDIPMTGSQLLQPQWRQRLIEVLKSTGVNLPVYWAGPVAVQCFSYKQKVALVNYNTNTVTGELNIADRGCMEIKLKPLDVQFIEI